MVCRYLREIDRSSPAQDSGRESVHRRFPPVSQQYLPVFVYQVQSAFFLMDVRQSQNESLDLKHGHPHRSVLNRGFGLLVHCSCESMFFRFLLVLCVHWVGAEILGNWCHRKQSLLYNVPSSHLLSFSQKNLRSRLHSPDIYFYPLNNTKPTVKSTKTNTTSVSRLCQ